MGGAALERGDNVAATARDPRTLDALVETHAYAVLPIQLDVTDRGAAFDALKRAADHFGKLDVVINKAGYGHFGMVEELTKTTCDRSSRRTSSARCGSRRRRSRSCAPKVSAVSSRSSSLGGITAFPAIGAYHASKWALEGLSRSLSQEVAGFGIDVTLIEPGGYSTDWVGPSAKRSEENPAYAGVREAQKRCRTACASSPPRHPPRKPARLALSSRRATR